MYSEVVKMGWENGKIGIGGGGSRERGKVCVSWDFI